VSKIGDRPAEGLNLTAEPAGNFSLVYPLEDAVFAGSAQRWVGQYAKPGAATFGVRQLRAAVNLPAQATGHDYLPSTWAKARVDALLEKIDREGEDTASIDEIIRLSRKYKFVTPYTSFLAAPRSLLRPRLIRPGDPVLRVRTDPAIVSVVAVFPFGLTKPLRYLATEDVWQTRFLAPAHLADGTHTVRLLLRDRQGRVYQEAKTFVIASQAPVVDLRLAKTRFRRGETVALRAYASRSARTITARLYGAPPAVLRWNPAAKASTGTLVIPAALPAGRYRITVTAEDFAHNIASREVTIDVTP
jgi:Ca-activated chloride channel family protein